LEVIGGIVNVRSVLPGRELRFPGCLLVLHKGLRQIVGDPSMDYIIAGIACLGLFIYLIYALLRPERF